MRLFGRFQLVLGPGFEVAGVVTLVKLFLGRT